MADMRKVAGDLYRIAGDMNDGADPVACVRRVDKVLDVNRVESALLERYGSSNTTNDLRRAMGKINNGNRSVTAVSVVVAQLKATALGCSKW